MKQMPSRALREAAGWRLVASLIRRHPDELQCIETHPGDGQYDNLTLVAPSARRPVVQLNREGSLVVLGRDGGEVLRNKDVWNDIVRSDDLRVLVNDIEDHAGLRRPPSTPSATADSLTYRLIATFLSHAALGAQLWECRNGYTDTSGYGGGIRREWFAMFPGAAERHQVDEPDDILRIPSYRFWFLIDMRQDEEAPALAVETTTGTAWDDAGRSYDLMRTYRADRRIWPVVWSIAGHLLP